MNGNSSHIRDNNTRTSPRFMYAMAKKLDGLSGNGTTGWWGCRVMKFFGICLDKFCPDDTTLPKDEYENPNLSIQAFLDAESRKIQFYQRLYSLDECMSAIYKHKIITISFDIFSSIKNCSDGIVTLPQIGEKYIGSHTVAAFGYSGTKKQIHFVNSCGESWGDKGYGYLPFEYFSEGLINEVWATFNPLIEVEKKYIKENQVLVKNKHPLRFKQVIYPSIRGNGKGVLVLDVYKNNRVIASAQICPLSKYEIELEELFVVPEFRTMGIGTELIQQLLKVAKQNKFKKIIGWVGAQDVVFERKKIIKKFFKQNHFTITNDNTRFKDSVYRIERRV